LCFRHADTGGTTLLAYDLITKDVTEYEECPAYISNVASDGRSGRFLCEAHVSFSELNTWGRGWKSVGISQQNKEGHP